MDKPLRKIMDDPKAARKLVLWVIELSEFDFIAEFIMGKTDDWGQPLGRFKRTDRPTNVLEGSGWSFNPPKGT